MSLHSRNFLPFHIQKPKPPPIDIEPRPGLEPEDDPFDKPYRFDKPVPLPPIKPSTEPTTEYHHCNLNFWWFIMGAIIISLLLFIVEYSERGVESEWYKNLELFPGSPDPVVLFLINTVFFLLLAWVTYHMFKHTNLQIVRYGAVFLMVAVFVTMLIWSLVLFSSNDPRVAMLFLIFVGIMLIGWILLSVFNNNNNELLIPLGLGFGWILYLLYFNLGIINNNDSSKCLI